MAIDFDNNETYDLFMAAFDKALQLDTFENRGRVRQMFRDQMKQLAAALSRAEAAAQARIAELEARLAEHEWHWGDELPPPYDWYLIFDWDAEDIDFAAMQVVWFDGEWNCELTHWRKLPEAPRAAWAEAHRRKAE